MRVKIYVEGAGPTDLQQRECRAAFASFFQSAGIINPRPAVVACGSRKAAYDDFVTAVKMSKPDVLPLLLVDSEDPVSTGTTVWQHLKKRDGWDRPLGVVNDQVFLMTQVMETWFLADREQLRNFFGTNLHEGHFKEWPKLEHVPKKDVFKALDMATAHCTIQYKKKVSFKLLAKIDARKVEAACPRALDLLNKLRDPA